MVIPSTSEILGSSYALHPIKAIDIDGFSALFFLKKMR